MYVIACLTAAGYAVATHVLSKAEKHGAPARRWRLYFIALRVPKAICNSPERIAEIVNAVHEVTQAMTIGNGDPKDFLLLGGSSCGPDDDPTATSDAKRQKKQAKVMSLMLTQGRYLTGVNENMETN